MEYANPIISSTPLEAPDHEDGEDLVASAVELRQLSVGLHLHGQRLDKVLVQVAPEFSRNYLQQLIDAGGICVNGVQMSKQAAKLKAGDALQLELRPTAQSQAFAPQAMDLQVVYQDAQVYVLDKPAGLVVHPAPGNWSGTLLNGLLAMDPDLAAVPRAGIVHRLDKDTSGVMVAAKTDAAHAGLSALFATHDIDRVYTAVVRGVPEPRAGLIRTQIGRSPTDRKKMAVLKAGGREAVTRYSVEETFGPASKPFAARIACRLETGRTHQIRVHMAHMGTPCLADAVYGGGPPALAVREAMAEAGLSRQALHASVLGFVHPITGQTLRFETPPPPDVRNLMSQLRDRT